MSHPAPFIPAALDEANLTPHEFRVFCRVCRRGDCIESIKRMASAMGMHPDTVRAALKTLARASMVHVTPRPGTTTLHEVRPPEEWDLTALEEDADPSENDGGDKNHPSENDGRGPWEMNGGDPPENDGGASKGYPIEGYPIEGYKGVRPSDDDRPAYLDRLVERDSWTAEPLPEDHPVRWDYLPGDWRWEAALYVLSELSQRRLLNSHYRRRLQAGVHPGLIASEWADTFRLLEDQDGYSYQEIRLTIAWLFQTDNWWIRTRNVQSAANSALRKADADGTTKFDKLIQSAASDYEQQQRDTTTQTDFDGIDDAVDEVFGDGASNPAPDPTLVKAGMG